MAVINIHKQQISSMQQLDKHSGLMTTYYAYEVDRALKSSEGYELMISKLQKAV